MQYFSFSIPSSFWSMVNTTMPILLVFFLYHNLCDTRSSYILLIVAIVLGAIDFHSNANHVGLRVNYLLILHVFDTLLIEFTSWQKSALRIEDRAFSAWGCTVPMLRSCWNEWECLCYWCILNFKIQQSATINTLVITVLMLSLFSAICIRLVMYVLLAIWRTQRDGWVWSFMIGMNFIQVK